MCNDGSAGFERRDATIQSPISVLSSPTAKKTVSRRPCKWGKCSFPLFRCWHGMLSSNNALAGDRGRRRLLYIFRRSLSGHSTIDTPRYHIGSYTDSVRTVLAQCPFYHTSTQSWALSIHPPYTCTLPLTLQYFRFSPALF